MTIDSLTGLWNRRRVGQHVAGLTGSGHAFAVVVIDTVGSAGAELEVALGSWPRVVRRLAIAAEGTNGAVVLITDRDARRPLPLPVAQRIELGRPSEAELSIRIAKDRRGRVSSPRTIHWTRPEPDLPEDDHERRVG
jgi:recombination protein RecA